jgi:Protein of unknown function (DUF2630)
MSVAMSAYTEKPLLDQIHDLVEQEKLLRSTHTGVGLNSSEREWLHDIEGQLDRCWALLRERRALDEFGVER